MQALLRSVLASHPTDLLKADRKGLSVKLTKSDIRGVRWGRRTACRVQHKEGGRGYNGRRSRKQQAARVSFHKPHVLSRICSSIKPPGPLAIQAE
jgi:hypothetical protein